MKKLTYEFVKQQYEKEGYKLLSKYKDCRTKDLLECPEYHEYEVKYNDFQQGHRWRMSNKQFKGVFKWVI